MGLSDARLVSSLLYADMAVPGSGILCLGCFASVVWSSDRNAVLQWQSTSQQTTNASVKHALLPAPGTMGAGLPAPRWWFTEPITMVIEKMQLRSGQTGGLVSAPTAAC